ncbi:MAG: TrkA C-terminal domain-containing protein [Nitrospira sp.]|nr:TrkA C-terminal domain-containing protein [Nitrospira sp.]MDH4251880.1 TrkA C-terminal domain-containing protein [Nitrospira sp.]MDH4343122.1 TrkA C-terminal domain-containing protein [Nitrospira sp.]MDH5336274.1 TrkA C-terminal domain-containing protein [Nitrospira sp.]
MTFELLGRVHKELSITGHAFYETILSISELVNRKVQIIRLHWQASTLLQRIDDVTAEVGQQIVVQVSDRLQDQSHPDSVVGVIDQTLADAISRVQELKQTLIGVDAEIRELKIETVHQNLLSLQQDLALRSGGIERLTVVRGAAAAGQPLSALPQGSSTSVAAVLRGPFLLAPTHDLQFRPGDIVVLVGAQTELDQLVSWFAGQRSFTASFTRVGVEE